MGLLDFGANVVMRLKADTSDAKAKLKELSAEERKAAEAAIKRTEAENKALERKAKSWQFAAQAVGAVTAAYAVGKSGLDAYAKTSEHAAAQVSRFKDATGKAFDSLMASIGKAVASMEPLISGVAKLVEKLSEVGVAGPAAIGALALAVTGNPVIAGIVGGGAWAVSGDYGSGLLLDDNGNINFANAAKRIYQDKRQRYYGQAGRSYGVDDFSKDLGKLPDLISAGLVYGLGKAGITKWSPFEVKKAGERSILDPDDLGTYGSRRRLGAGSGSIGASADPYGVASARESDAVKRFIDAQRRAFDAGSRGLMSPYAAQGAGIVSAQESQLSRVFGPLSDFDAYASAFETLTGAIGSALSAWIDGSMSAGKAFKAFIAEAVKGLAVQMTIEALKHGAYAIGSLAMGSPAQAALHGKAAAGFAAGALAATIAAKGLHGGGSGGPGGAGNYRPSAPSSPYTQPMQTAAPVIVVGSPFAYDSPRNQQRNAKRLVAMTTGTSAVEYR